MTVSRQQLAAIIAKTTLKGSVKTKVLGREIAAYLLSEKRTGELDSLLRDVAAERAKQGIIEVTAVSAHSLTPAVRADIQAQAQARYPKAKRIIMNERIDKAMIGGVKIELPDSQLDLSIRAKLNRFKQLTTSERTM